MEQKAKLHPLISIAAVSVTVFSLAGIGVVTGLLPHSSATRTEAAIPVAAPSAATAELVQAAAADPVQVPPAPRPAVKKPVAHKAAPVKVAQAPAAVPPPPQAPVALDPVPVAPAAPAVPAPAMAPRPACAECGTVENFRQVDVKGDGSALGAVAGGAAGAVLGHQFGRSSGKDLLTIAGAIGGAFAGHEIEKNVRKKTRYEISVRMEDGSLRTLQQDAAPAWRVGERVRIVDNHVIASS
jgi:outer membrane lipoprotein SlyB